MISLYDLLEKWAKKKGWWTYKSSNKDKFGYHYINISAKWSKDNSHPDFDSITTVCDNEVAFSNAEPYEELTRYKLSPADPEYFKKLELILVERRKP